MIKKILERRKIKYSGSEVGKKAEFLRDLKKNLSVAGLLRVSWDEASEAQAFVGLS